MSVLANASGILSLGPKLLAPLLSDWLGVVRQVANLVIIVANIALAHSLLALARRDRNALSRRHLVILLALLMSGCGAVHLALVLAYPTPTRPTTTLLKVVVGVYWIIVSIRFPNIVAAPLRIVTTQPQLTPQGMLNPRRSPAPLATAAERGDPVPVREEHGPSRAADSCAFHDSLRENRVQSEQWLGQQSEAIRQLREFLSDIELGDNPCKT